MAPERGDSWKIVEAIKNDPETKARYNVAMAIGQAVPGAENFTNHMLALVNNLKRLKEDELADRAQTIVDSYKDDSPEAIEDAFNDLVSDVRERINKLSEEDSRF